MKSPKACPKFTKYWKILIDEVKENEKFKKSDLLRLETLCDLYVEKDDLNDILALTGLTYDAGEGRNGVQIKIRPEVAQLNKVKADILNYSRSLGLMLKETKHAAANTEEKDEWE